MKCTQCHGDTACINSRQYPSPKQADIPKRFRETMSKGDRWRRYRCLECGTTMDTLESIAPE
jgi:hypothetical protein